MRCKITPKTLGSAVVMTFIAIAPVGRNSYETDEPIWNSRDSIDLSSVSADREGRAVLSSTYGESIRYLTDDSNSNLISSSTNSSPKSSQSWRNVSVRRMRRENSCLLGLAYRCDLTNGVDHSVAIAISVQQQMLAHSGLRA